MQGEDFWHCVVGFRGFVCVAATSALGLSLSIKHYVMSSPNVHVLHLTALPSSSSIVAAAITLTLHTLLNPPYHYAVSCAHYAVIPCQDTVSMSVEC